MIELNNSKAISNLKYAKDCLSSGHILSAKMAIDKSIELIECDDLEAVDDNVVRLLKSGLNG